MLNFAFEALSSPQALEEKWLIGFTSIFAIRHSEFNIQGGRGDRTRTCDRTTPSRAFYQLNYSPIYLNCMPNFTRSSSVNQLNKGLSDPPEAYDHTIPPAVAGCIPRPNPPRRRRVPKPNEFGSPTLVGAELRPEQNLS